MRALARRVGTIEARRPTADGGPPFLVLFPDTWAQEDQAAFEGDDAAAKEDAVTRNTGVRPGPATHFAVIRVRPDGPQ
jgi:hypothetical protein